MPEETTTTETTTEETTEVTTTEVAPVNFDPFGEQPEQVTQTEVVNETVTETAEVKGSEITTNEEEEIVDANEYLKTNLGFDDWDTAKAAMVELKTLKEKAQTPAEIKYANEESKRIIEALQTGDTEPFYEYITTQKTLAAVDKMDAESAIKLKIKQDNKHYTSADIQDVFEEKYSTDEKPEQGVDELEDEFAKRLSKWETKAEKVNRRIERDAVTAKAELSKLRSEIVLPDIFKKEEVKKTEPTPEELATKKSYDESYLKAVDTSVQNFAGFSTTVIDKDVKIPVAYNLSDEQKTEVSNAMKTLAANNYDVNVLFAPKWLKENGTLDTDRMTKDVARMLYGDQVEQKFANEAASKRVIEQSKKNSNVHLKSNSTPQRTFAPVNTAEQQKQMAEFFFQNG